MKTNERTEAVGVIGGSGLYDLPGLTDVREVELATPFGPPSDAYVTGRLGGVPVTAAATGSRPARSSSARTSGA